MSKFIDEFTGLVYDYDPATDVGEWIVCSAPTRVPGMIQPTIGRSTYTDFRLAKLEQIRLFTEEGIEAWIEYLPAMGPPTVEAQLDALRRL